MNIPPRYRFPIAILASVVAVALTFAGVSFLGQPGPTDRPSHSATARLSATPNAGDTPESAVRAFFSAFAEAGKTNDPSTIEPFVSGTASSAYLTASAFLRGQEEVGKASITTVNELSDVDVAITGDQATVEFTYVAGGYDIDAATGEPLESPVVLPAERVRAVVVLQDDQWLVDSYEAVR